MKGIKAGSHEIQSPGHAGKLFITPNLCGFRTSNFLYVTHLVATFVENLCTTMLKGTDIKTRVL
jgi:hypothetical protein